MPFRDSDRVPQSLSPSVSRAVRAIVSRTADGASLDLQGATVNLRVNREDEVMVGDASQTRFGYDHIGLLVEDVDTAYADLKKRGFNFFMAPKDIPDLRIAFFRGPEDITIELIQKLG